MIIEKSTLETCSAATGIVVVIDVLRAFSTAAYAFGQGAKSITLVSSVEDAFSLKKQFPYMRLMGETGGLPINGFDYSNSPTQIAKQDLTGCHLIQRTSAGTQGIIFSIHATTLLATSFCCASATARFIKQQSENITTFVITGRSEGGWGDEDDACADYIEKLIKGEKHDALIYLQRVRESLVGEKFLDENQPDFPSTDMDYCTSLDRFDFFMLVERQAGLFVMKPVIAD